jgi:hypothetical protein
LRKKLVQAWCIGLRHPVMFRIGADAKSIQNYQHYRPPWKNILVSHLFNIRYFSHVQITNVFN